MKRLTVNTEQVRWLLGVLFQYVFNTRPATDNAKTQLLLLPAWHHAGPGGDGEGNLQDEDDLPPDPDPLVHGHNGGLLLDRLPVTSKAK